tara:strand:+ start:116 stop:1300 length:1185 start_codon:yes stop_codon:yes gene_type:complete
MIIKGVDAKSILDSRKEATIEVSIKTNVGKFSASAPNGRSTGKREAKSYKKNLDGDIKALKDSGDYFSEEVLEDFDDLKLVEDVLEGHIGANSLFAFESACLKAMAKEKNKEVWQLINPKAKKFPRLLGNCIEGGKHSSSEKKPDFQEFLLIPNSKSPSNSHHTNREAKVNAQVILKNISNFGNRKTDEGAWMVELDDKKVLEVLKDLKDNVYDERKIYLDEGVDVAASSFRKRQNYMYLNPMLKRDRVDQLGYLTNLIKNFHLLYIEDPFHEEDFEGFAQLLKKFPDRLIVGDDLTVTSIKRLQEAVKNKSINGIVVKPNQCGSLLEVKEVCKISRENGIKIVFSHRSGETKETILADLAFGFGADFFKCGIDGDIREGKIKRLIEIENSLKK